MPVVPGTHRITVVPLTPDRWADLAELFGRRGADGGCWCMFWRLPSSEFGRATNDANRESLRGLAGSDPSPGLVAYMDGAAVGWVGLGPRRSFERLNRSRTIPTVDDRSVWSVVCFFVRRAARNAGVTGRLLSAAVEYARDHGAPGVEGYPFDPEGGRIPDALAYVGTRGAFERAGFTIVSATDARSGGRPRVVARLDFPPTP